MTRPPAETRARDLGRRPFRGRGTLDRLWPVWTGLVVGPVAWGLAVGASYTVVPVTCELGTTVPLHLIRLVTLAAAVGATAVAFGQWRKTRGEGAAVALDRTAFLALMGVFLSGMSALLIGLEGVANFVVDPCR